MVPPRKVLWSGAALIVLGVLAAVVLIPGPRARPRIVRRTDRRPNIVFVLTDDLTWDLLRFMPHVRQLQRDGMTFRQFMVSDSLCCSSRATIFTGEFPHDTHVLGNTPPFGGYDAFHAGGADRRSVAISLQRSGYRTALFGKYLNGYQPFREGEDPGWSDWLGSSYAYDGFGYEESDNGRPMIAGYRPRDYVTNALARHALRFIRSSAGRTPFFAEIATYAPHSPFTPAPRDRSRFRHLRLPRGGAFDAPSTSPPTWLGHRPPLRRDQIAAPAAGLPLARAVGPRRGPDDRAAARGVARGRRGAQHVHRVLVRQRLPPRPAPADRRQAHGVRLRHPCPADRGRTGRGTAPGDVGDDRDGRSRADVRGLGAAAGRSRARRAVPDPAARWPATATLAPHAADRAHRRHGATRRSGCAGLGRGQARQLHRAAHPATRPTSSTPTATASSTTAGTTRTSFTTVAAQLTPARLARLSAALARYRGCHGASACFAAGFSAPCGATPERRGSDFTPRLEVGRPPAAGPLKCPLPRSPGGWDGPPDLPSAVPRRGGDPRPRRAHRRRVAARDGRRDEPPNIVFVLTDDLSWDLVPYMPNVRRLQREGMTFRQFVVSDSLCCSSRATILTGEFPHNTHVLGNTQPGGGYPAFIRHGARRRCVGLSLQRAGYRTGAVRQVPEPLPRRIATGKDPGWDRLARARAPPMTASVISSPTTATRCARAPSRVTTSPTCSRVAPNGSSAPRTGTRSSCSCRRTRRTSRTFPPRGTRGGSRHLRQPRGGSFDKATRNAPRWLGRRRALTAQQRLHLLHAFRLRARSVQAVDEMIGRLRATARGPRRRPSHVLHLQLRQRLPPRPAPPDRGQAHRIRP